MIGSGAGLVVLKRLDDALRDGDTIHAVIKGTGRQQRRRRQGRLHRAQRERPGRSHPRGATDCWRDGRIRRLHRGARHRHGARRPDRAGRADAGLPGRFRSQRGYCAIGSRQDQRRPPRCGGRRHRPHQDGDGACSTRRCRPACTTSGPTRRSISRRARSTSTPPPRPGPRVPRRAARASARSASAAPMCMWCSKRRRPRSRLKARPAGRCCRCRRRTPLRCRRPAGSSVAISKHLPTNRSPTSRTPCRAAAAAAAARGIVANGHAARLRRRCCRPRAASSR